MKLFVTSSWVALISISHWLDSTGLQKAHVRFINSRLNKYIFCWLQIANYLPKLHMDLQKFAVAFEELIEDESRPKFQEALLSTQSYLTMMLCEVESNIVVLPSLKLPMRVQRSIMSNTEREPIDVTRRLVRDWGILLKYKHYLHAWRRVFDY